MKYEIGKEYILGRAGTYKFIGYLFEAYDEESNSAIVDENGYADTFCEIVNKNNSFVFRGLDYKVTEKPAIQKYHVAYKDDSGKWRISKLKYESIDAFIEDFKLFTFTSHTLLVD